MSCRRFFLLLVHWGRAGQGPQSLTEKVATIASLPFCVHGVQDTDVFPLRAGDGLAVIADGEVSAGVAVACPGLR